MSNFVTENFRKNQGHLWGKPITTPGEMQQKSYIDFIYNLGHFWVFIWVIFIHF
jgi:4-alpha-glucanotransferase